MKIRSYDPLYLRRRVRLFRERYEDSAERFDAYRRQAEALLTEHLRNTRRVTARLENAERALVSNNVTITELQSQVAVQHQMLAEAQGDASEAIARYNRAVQMMRPMLPASTITSAA
jgi:hypothetical protein